MRGSVMLLQNLLKKQKQLRESERERERVSERKEVTPETLKEVYN